MERREEYDGEVPDGVLVLTLACDVQKDRLEILVMGHGVDDEKWMVSGDIIWGDPSEEFVWNELRKIIQRPWSLHNGKEIAITASFVDSGYLTPQVYKFCKQMQPFRVFATKGVGGPGRPAVGRPTKSNSQKLPVFPIGTNGLKEVLFNRLKVSDPGPAYIHISHDFDDEFCLQLTAEKAVKKYSKGIPRIEWVKIRARNEALDLSVLNLACYTMLNVNEVRVAKKLEEVREEKPGKVRRRRNWVSKW